MKIFLRFFLSIIISAVCLSGCSKPLDWPQSPLYKFPGKNPDWVPPSGRAEAMKEIEGHYAHYDIVAYEDMTTDTPMKTFVVSYGFTDFYIEDDRLFQKDSFCFAGHIINQPNVKSTFGDAAVQAIRPRVREVELRFEQGEWKIYRPPSPALLGIEGDPSLPLSEDPDDPDLTDPDRDGKPGVTVVLEIGGFIKGEIYITRREIYADYLTLKSDGNLYGYVEDSSEQFVVGASMEILRQQSDPVQNPDMGLSPMILVRVDDDIDSCEDLKEIRDLIFPEEPVFSRYDIEEP